MNPSEIAPTKTNLFEYKGQLEFSVDGHNLLEEKREVLVMHLMDILADLKDRREKLNLRVNECRQSLRKTRLSMGELELSRSSGLSKKPPQTDILEKGVMGVNLPTIKLTGSLKKGESPQPLRSFTNTSESYDMLRRDLAELMVQISETAQIEASAWRLAYEIKKTQRRVNALENVFIPEFKDILKFIQDTLEERDRETFFQMKKVKKGHENSEKA